MRKPTRLTEGHDEIPERYEEPYRALWRSLTPRERLRRSWNLRRRVPDIHRLHDAKLPPLP
jgi:hypothetical protein